MLGNFAFLYLLRVYCLIYSVYFHLFDLSFLHDDKWLSDSDISPLVACFFS